MHEMEMMNDDMMDDEMVKMNDEMMMKNDTLI